MFRAFIAYFRLVYLSVFRSKGTHARFTAKRFAVMSVLLPLLFIGQLIHWVCFLIDDILFRGYKKIEIVDPVFIVGIPRSGTTLLHRLMAQDTEQFTSLKLWEMLIAPSITERKFWALIGRIDRALGGFGRRLVEAIDARLFRNLEKIHKMSLFDFDEDEMILTHVYASVYLFFPFPFRDEMWRFVRFDELTGVAEKERVMRFYKDCIRRHLYFHGPQKRFLSKNPAFSAKVGALREYFPGARLICNVRSPYNTVPSLFSALYVAWDMFDNDPTGDVFRNSVLEIAAHWYRHPLIQEHNWPDNRFAFLTYDALVNDLEAAVLGLYQRLEINAGPHFAERLRLEHESARKYKSSHRYSLEKYGLTSEGILNDFGDIFQRFGFDTANPADTEVRRQEAQ